MIPSDMKLKIRSGTVGYNNKILVSDGNFSLGKNDEVNLAVPAMKSHKTNSLEIPAIKNHKTNSIEPTTITTSQGLTHTPAISQKTNSLETPAIKSHKTNSLETPAMKSTKTAVNSERTADLEQKTIISHEDEKVALVLSLTGIFTIWFIFR